MAETLSAFSRFARLFNPLRAARDFRDAWVQETPHRWRFLALSAAVTFCIFSVMFQEEHRIDPRSPEIDFITVFETGRSDAEILASNIENQRRKEAERAEQEAIDAEIRRRYEVVGEAMGMDTSEARARGEAERAAAAEAEQEARQRARERLEQQQQ